MNGDEEIEELYSLAPSSSSPSLPLFSLSFLSCNLQKNMIHMTPHCYEYRKQQPPMTTALTLPLTSPLNISYQQQGQNIFSPAFQDPPLSKFNIIQETTLYNMDGHAASAVRQATDWTGVLNARNWEIEYVLDAVIPKVQVEWHQNLIPCDQYADLRWFSNIGSAYRIRALPVGLQ